MDRKFILGALNLARKNLGLTAPNPSVGCLIVKNGEIIASGATAKGGTPHAETIAINKVADKNRLTGATLYVSLEPCCHFGKTPPCTDIIIKSGITRVVIAQIDVDERVLGKGIEKLQENGIKVDILEEKAAKNLNKAFFKAKSTGFPYISLKLAVSLDGKIATKSFDSKWITNEKSRLYAHHLRSINDAIMIGANTLRRDNPMLDCRIKGLEEYSPTRIIITNKGDFDENLQIFQTAKKIPTIILSTKIFENFSALENLGVKIILCEEKNGLIDLKLALKKICASGVNALLIEGGQNLATQFLKENLADELIWIQNKKIIGDDGISAIGALGFRKISEVLDGFKRVDLLEFEDDVVGVYEKGGVARMGRP